LRIVGYCSRLNQEARRLLNIIGAVVWLGAAASLFVAPYLTPFFLAAMVAVLLWLTVRRARK
jgi:predicted PurR-regulated permease PerM